MNLAITGHTQSFDLHPQELDRAQRDREIAHLEKKLAYDAARSDIELFCTGEVQTQSGGPAVIWYDTLAITPEPRHAEDVDFIDRAVRYLELRRLLVRHPNRAHLVCVKDWL